MIEAWARKVVKWQVKNSHLSEKDDELYTYAYGLLIGQIINILIACLLAVVFDAYVVVAVYLVSYIPLRSYAGGHHADSYGMCTMISAAILSIVCILTQVIVVEFVLWINIIGSLFAGSAILVLAPVEDHNKKLEQEEQRRYRKISIAIWFIETIIWILFYCGNIANISLVITLSHMTVAVLLIAGAIKNRCISQ